MRVILILWFIPVFVFWGWYALSVNDLNMGMFFLTRQFHDHLFGIYASILHLPREDVPVAIAGVFAFDSILVLGLAALRWYKKWMPVKYSRVIDQHLVWAKDKALAVLGAAAFWRKQEEPSIYDDGMLSEERIARYLQGYPRPTAE